MQKPEAELEAAKQVVGVMGDDMEALLSAVDSLTGYAIMEKWVIIAPDVTI